MTSRDAILNRIRALDIEETPYPDETLYEGKIDEPLVERFSREVHQAGGSVQLIDDRQALIDRLTDVASGAPCWSAVKDVNPPSNLANRQPKLDELERLDLTLLEGSVGVAENGAVWVPETAIGTRRVAPFITRHLAVILSRELILENMHLTYRKLTSHSPSFGCFICGPSKTADIEQSLVMGAHGPEQYTVFLI